MKENADEHLGVLWDMKEHGLDMLEEMKTRLGESFSREDVHNLASDGLIVLSDKEETIALTEEGERKAKQVIRARRIAERLVYDVLGGNFEAGACEFEHIVSLELVDSICTLLGHPRECPHGLLIPEGDCCKRRAKTAECLVLTITELEIGQSARIAYVKTASDTQLHKMNGLHILPGSVIKLHQRYPSYVIECEGASIALDDEIASSICVWKESHHFSNGETGRLLADKKKGKSWLAGFGFSPKKNEE